MENGYRVSMENGYISTMARAM